MGEGREGDWECGSCANRNYAFRSLCNRCKQPRLLVDTKTPADSKWLPRIGDWICTGCSNNNYASREKCKKCGQPKEVAAMPALVAITAPAYFVLPNGWRTGDWICNCGFHNYSSRAECKQCNVSLPPAPGTTSSMLNTAHGTKRLASEECFGEWDNKRLNAGDLNNQFLTNQLSSYQGYEHIGCPSNDKASVLYPYSSGSSASSLNSQVHIQLPQPAPLPILLGKGAKQWRDGDWLCTNCNNHNYASRSQCNRMYQWDDPTVFRRELSALKEENAFLKLALDTSTTDLKTIQDEKIAQETKVHVLEGEVEIGLHTADMFKKNANEAMRLLTVLRV